MKIPEVTKTESEQKSKKSCYTGKKTYSFGKRGKENRSSTQQRPHNCLKQGNIAEIMFG